MNPEHGGVSMPLSNHPCATRPGVRLRPAAGVAVVALAACGGGAGGPTSAAPAAMATATEAEWRTFATPRPAPLPGSVRLTVGEIRLTQGDPWGLDAGVSAPLGVSELVVAGLLRRPDVHFVERRRFTAAADRERRGQTRARGAPPVGVSPGVEVVLSGTWARVAGVSAYLEMRLTDVETGDIVRTWRTTTSGDADPVSLARAIVGGLLAELDAMGRRPTWADPVAAAAPTTYRAAGVPTTAWVSFLEGLAAEERWDWEGARRGYQAATAAGFFEAQAALARAARLRLGGTLAES